MDTDNKVSNDLYKVYGEAFFSKNVSTASVPLNSSSLINKLNNVIGVGSLDDEKINNLLKATDNL